MLEVLNRPIELGALRHKLSAWSAPVRACLSNALPVWLFERHAQIGLYPESDGFRIETSADGEVVDSQYVAATELAAAEQFLHVSARSRPTTRTVCLHLVEKQYLRKEILLPRVALGNLAAAASLQIDVETPFQERDVYVSATAIRTTGRPDPVPIELLVAPKRLVDAILQQLSASGIDVDLVLVEASAHVSRPHQLLRNRRTTRRWWQSAITGGLAACVALEVFAAIYLPLLIRKSEADIMEAKMAAMVSGAAEIDAALSRGAEDLAVARYALDAKASGASTIEILRVLTAAIPDHTYVDRFKYRPNQIELSGLTPSTSALVDELGRTKLFKNPTYMTPAARQQDGLERFNISLQLEAQEAP
jgi:Tfp pilus assembly protein PilN